MSETKITKMVVQKEGRKLIFNPAGDIDLSQYYTKSEIDSKFNSYALKTEIPDTSNLATKTELNSVKSTATTANSTANSAKTTAQNALNTANSNGFKTVYKSVNTNGATSIKTSENCFFKNYNMNNAYAPYIDGFAMNALRSTLYGSNEWYNYYIGIVAKDKTISNLATLNSNNIVAEYVH